MRDTIDNVRDVTDHAAKMAFLWNTTGNSRYHKASDGGERS